VTPTQRTVAECKRRGWPVQNVEQTIRIPGGRTFKRDLFGIIDLIAIVPADLECKLLGNGFIVGIQTTSGSNNHALRRHKALAQPRLKQWIDAGGRFEVWSWSKQGPRGKRKTWQLRIERITAEMFEQKASAA
jgi:hypothetical protein